jgi:hypothetical protein
MVGKLWQSKLRTTYLLGLAMTIPRSVQIAIVLAKGITANASLGTYRALIEIGGSIAVNISYANKENTSYFTIRPKRKKAGLRGPW